jgi:predicted Zn-dependent peptidase
MKSFFIFLIFCCYSALCGNYKKLIIPHEKYVLDNGLNVILSVDPSTPFVAVNLWYNVGSNNETIGKTGLAHLFEHLMFEGSAHAEDDQYIKITESSGAFALNATTNFDRTNYYITVPKRQLELALALEASRMSFLTISQAKLDEQIKVVANERRQRFEMTPYGLASLELWQKLFPKTHPMHGAIIGSHEDIENANLSDVKSFYNKHYGPTNASLVIVGDFDKEKTKLLIKKYFATLPKTKAVTKVKLPLLSDSPQEIIRVPEKLAQLSLLRIQYISPALFSPGDAELDIISNILAGGEHSRLIKALTRDKHLASSVSAVQQSFEKLSVFSIDAILNPNVKESDALNVIDNVIADLITNPPRMQEINRARDTILTNYFFGLQELGGSFGRAETLQSYNRFAGDPNFIQKDIARYNAVSQTSIIECVKKYLPLGKNRKILEAIPEKIHVAHKE